MAFRRSATTSDAACCLPLHLGGGRSCARVERSAKAARAWMREHLAHLQRVDRVLSRLVQACSHGRAPGGECPILDALELEED